MLFTGDDYVFCRSFNVISGLEKAIQNARNSLKLNILKWKNGSDLLSCFNDALKDVYKSKIYNNISISILDSLINTIQSKIN